MKQLILLVLTLALCGCFMAQSAPAPQSPPASASMFVQSKACVRSTVDGYIHSCQFDNPVTAGDLTCAEHYGGDAPRDNQGNIWQQVSPSINNFNCVVGAKGGVTTVDFSGGNLGGALMALMVEYKPVLGIDTHTDPDTGAIVPSATYGTYKYQNLETPQGASWDSGWAPPIYTDNPCDLFISWSFAGSYELFALHPDHVPTAGPGFTVRDTEYGDLAIEDAIFAQPGIYIASISWNTAAHWEEGLVAFKTGMTSCGN